MFTIDGSDCNIANAIISSTKSKSQKVLTLDSLQNVKLSDKTETEDYISAMKKNYDTLKEALN